MKHLSRLIPYLGKYKSGVLVGLVFVAIANAFAAISPWIIGRTVDTIEAMIGMEFVIPLIVHFMIIVILEGIARFYMRRVLIGISRTIEYDLRNDLFARVQQFSTSVFDNIRTGEIMSRATNDLSNVRMVLGPGIMYSFTTITMLSFVLTIMFGISTKLTLLSLIPMPFLSIAILAVSKVLHQRYSKVQNSLASLTTVVQENISGIRVVKGHCREESEIDYFLKENNQLRESNLAAARIYSGFHPFMMIFAGLSTLIMLYFGGAMVAEGKISLGDLVAFFAYLGLLIWPMTSLGWVINLFQRGAASMKLINELMDTEPDIKSPANGHKFESTEGEINFKNISFKYGEDEPTILDNINLEIKPGMTVAVVGPTGSGKSTLLKLVVRQYDPTNGLVTLDDIDLKTADLKSLREQIGYVPQETFLLSESVAENIGFGAHGNEVSDDEIEKAAEISRLSRDIDSFKDGYQTMLGERGINLSGGQKQRTAIARALVGNPGILLLDDCMSAVDTKTEKDILAGLKEEMKKRTSIIVSHRMSSIMDSDLIVVLDEGQIVEQGTHQQLLTIKGIYSDMWNKQQLSEELEKEAV